MKARAREWANVETAAVETGRTYVAAALVEFNLDLCLLYKTIFRVQLFSPISVGKRSTTGSN